MLVLGRRKGQAIRIEGDEVVTVTVVEIGKGEARFSIRKGDDVGTAPETRSVALRESFAVGDDVEMKLCKVYGGHVRIGTQAPRHMRIDREEVFQEWQKAGIA